MKKQNLLQAFLGLYLASVCLLLPPMLMRIKISNHAYERAKDRFGWSKDVLNKMMDRVVEKGISNSQTKTHLHKYISGLTLRHGSSNVKIYGENIFFFKGDTLTTLYRLPNELIKYTKFLKI